MKKLLYNPFVIIVLFLLAVGTVVFLPEVFRETPTDKLTQAFESYRAGEKAANVAARQEAFNRALALYTDLNDRYHPGMGNGKLYYNIADTYFQLGEYPWALLYGYRALDLRRTDERVLHTIEVARAKLTLPPVKEASGFHTLFFFHTLFSIPERLQLFVIFGLCAVAGFSLGIWINRKGLFTLSLFPLIACVVLFLSLGYSYYVSPIEAVIVRSTDLYRDAGAQYASVQDKPIASGEKVEVLDIVFGGKWLKIRTPEGIVGYAPNDAVKII